METKPTKRERVKYPNQQLAISYHTWCDNGKKPVRPGPSLTARWGGCNAKCSAGVNSRGVNISAPGDATGASAGEKTEIRCGLGETLKPRLTP